MSDGKVVKMLVVDEIHTNQGGFYKLPNGLYAHYSCGEVFLDDLRQPKRKNNAVVDIEKLKRIGKQWYQNCVGRSNFTVLGGTVMSKGNLDKFTEKEQYNEQTASED